MSNDTFVRGAIRFNFPDGSVHAGALWERNLERYARVEGKQYVLEPGTYRVLREISVEAKMLPGAPENKRDSIHTQLNEGDTSSTGEAHEIALVPADHYLRLWVAARNENARLQEEIAALKAQLDECKQTRIADAAFDAEQPAPW
jgi:hypothetical protein